MDGARRAFILVGLAGLCAWARVEEDQPPGAPGAGTGPGADVYVNDSFEASDAILQARRLAATRRWEDAARILQKTSDQAGDKLTPVGPDVYKGVRDRVNEVIAGWPPEGRAAYQAFATPRLEGLTDTLGDSRNLEDWMPLFDRFFCTDAAAELAGRIGQMALESGAVALARSVYQRVLEHHPNHAAWTPRYTAMLRVLSAFEGQADPGDPRQTDEEYVIRWMGQGRRVREVTAEIAARFTRSERSESASDWPTFGGNPERNRLVHGSIDEIGLLWRVPWSDGASARPSAEEAGASFVSRSRTARLSCYPVTAAGFIYVQKADEIIAFRRENGGIAWRFRPYGSVLDEREDEDPTSAAWDSLTVDDGKVFAAISPDAGVSYGADRPNHLAELTCLDARSGELLWRTGNRLPAEQGWERSFDSAPLVRHGRVFVVGRHRRSFGFEDVYLYGFDAADGSLRFQTHLASGSTGFLGSRTSQMSVTASHDEKVFVCTHIGAVAAVSGSTGSVAWLRTYERDAARPASGSVWSVRERLPAEVNPIIHSQGRLFCLPHDSDRLWVLGANDGRLLHSLALEPLGGWRTIIGVKGDLVCATGETTGCLDLASGATRWSTEPSADDKPCGRGQWVGDELWIPTEAALLRYRVTDGSASSTAWDPESDVGNLLVTADHLLVAGVDHLSAYVKKADLWTALRGRVSAAPADPGPALDLAEAALRAGEFLEAVTMLDEAMRRAQSLVEVAPPERRRLFDTTLAFAEKMSSRAQLSTPLLDKLFSYAGQYAPDAAAHVELRVRFAKWFDAAGRPESAVNLYQQILGDRSLRDLDLNLPEKGSQRAGGLARRRIDEIIERHGRKSYAAFDGEARRRLESAQAANDEAAIREVVETYPNSEVAPAALIACGERHAAGQRFLEAVKWYLKAYRQYPGSPDRPLWLFKMVEACERAGRPDLGAHWLIKACREYPHARFDVRGQLQTFLEYRRRAAATSDGRASGRPRIDLPLVLGDGQWFRAPASLLMARFASHPATAWSRVYTWGTDGIRAFNARTGGDAWPRPIATDARPELLLATADLAVFGTTAEVYAVEAVSGRNLWKLGPSPERKAEPPQDWEDADPIRAFALDGDRLVSVRDGGQMSCIDIRTGRELWSRLQRPVPAGRIRLADRCLVFPIAQDDRMVFCLIDASSGAWIDAILTDDSHAVEELFLTIDDRLVSVTALSVSAYDLTTRKLRWRWNPEGYIRRRSLLFDVDALYFTDDGVRLRKLDLYDGSALWESERLLWKPEDEFQVDREGEQVIVSGTSAVVSVDMHTGITLWRATGPGDPQFPYRLLTEKYVVALHVLSEPDRDESTAYFFDHRNASGLPPKEGGVLPLGKLTDIRAVAAADGSLWVQTGGGLVAWFHR
jgi:outer membrane protein assembly factor BamB